MKGSPGCYIVSAVVIVGVVGLLFYAKPSMSGEKQFIVYKEPIVPAKPIFIAEKMSKGQDVLNKMRTIGLVDNLSNQNIDAMTIDQMLFTIHSYLDNNDIKCRRTVRMGKVGDGGWEICDDADIRPEQPCIIYSFGINYDFTFDEDASKLYGCHVYSFDPSMSKMETGNRSALVHFHRLGLDGKTYTNKKGWKLSTYSDIRKMLGHENSVIDVVKMDIESSEWPSLPNMIETNQLENVRQLLVEYHVTQQTREYILPRLKTIQSIEKLGFKKFLVHKNPACKTVVKDYPVLRTMCYEIYYMRR